MGLIASSVRLLYLNNYRLDLESKILEITHEKLRLTSSMHDLMNVGTDMDPDGP